MCVCVFARAIVRAERLLIPLLPVTETGTGLSRERERERERANMFAKHQMVNALCMKRWEEEVLTGYLTYKARYLVSNVLTLHMAKRLCYFIPQNIMWSVLKKG